MIDPPTLDQLREAIVGCIDTDQGTLDKLREEIRPLCKSIRPIQPRATTSISIVGTDGGNNQLRFDPFLIQLVRVVDSSNNEYCLEAISPTTPIEKVSERQFSHDGTPRTSLGEMMSFLDVGTLPALSHMIRPNQLGKPVSPSWVQVYRELVEWAILFSILKKDFGTDTLIVCDGLSAQQGFCRRPISAPAQGHEGANRRASGNGAAAAYLPRRRRKTQQGNLAIPLGNVARRRSSDRLSRLRRSRS